MPTCSFCKKNYEFPRGLTLFTIDGRSVYFCSSKCKRNADLKRDPKKVNWVKRNKKVKDKSKVSEKVEGEKVEKKEKTKVEEKVKEKKKEVKEESIGKKGEKVEEVDDDDEED